MKMSVTKLRKVIRRVIVESVSPSEIDKLVQLFFSGAPSGASIEQSLELMETLGLIDKVDRRQNSITPNVTTVRFDVTDPALKQAIMQGLPAYQKANPTARPKRYSTRSGDAPQISLMRNGNRVKVMMPS